MPSTISIHSPRMGRDLLDNRALKDERLFQSTLPAWGETMLTRPREEGEEISIHSPRMGRDPAPISTPTRGRNFNPLSPHGERLDGEEGAECQN